MSVEREPEADSRSGSTTIWYWRSKPPSEATSATPATACSAGRTVKSCSAAQLGEVHAARAVLQHVLVDPADAARVGTERRRDARGQQLLHASELLEHARARPVDVGALAEDGVGEAHAEHRVAADRLDAGRALQRAHERIGDLVLDQIGTAAHPLGEDDDLRVGEIRQRIERRLSQESAAPQSASANTAPKTTHLCRTDSSMMRSTMAVTPRCPRAGCARRGAED